MKAFGNTKRIAAGTTGFILLAGLWGGSVAFAEDQHGTGDVEVTVDIGESVGPGVLAMSVSGSSVALTEDGSTDLVRQFTGKLPTVTVTDTRSADDIPEGAWWYVVGSVSDFTGNTGQDSIPAEQMGWTPALVQDSPSGLVSEGDEVGTSLEGDVGLVDQELLAMVWDSKEVNPEGTWAANADLFLQTAPSVEEGQYSATLTLSLFE